MTSDQAVLDEMMQADAYRVGLMQVSRDVWVRPSQVLWLRSNPATPGYDTEEVTIYFSREHTVVVKDSLRNVMAYLSGSETWRSGQRVP